MKIKVGILGASGYVGSELVRLLLHHPRAQIVYIGSKNHLAQNYQELHPQLGLDLCFSDEDLSAVELDVLFAATPHELSASFFNENLLKRMKIIDLSAAFRLKNLQNYELYYGFTHPNAKLVQDSIYGLCELYGEEIRAARLVANPGCYTTCSILSLYPLVKEGLVDENSIIIDAKSGVSGAGRAARLEHLFCEVNENLRAYALTSHRHLPELEEQLGRAAGRDLAVQFSPHLVPMQRGILTTSYANLRGKSSEKDLRALYQTHYANKPFVRILAEKTLPQTRWVRGSNFMDINLSLDARTGRVIVLGALDNLIKGAAGQAVQNMNLMFGLDEGAGLEFFAAL